MHEATHHASEAVELRLCCLVRGGVAPVEAIRREWDINSTHCEKDSCVGMLLLTKHVESAEASMQIVTPDLPGSQSQPKLLVKGEDVVGNCLGQLHQCTEERGTRQVLNGTSYVWPSFDSHASWRLSHEQPSSVAREECGHAGRGSI